MKRSGFKRGRPWKDRHEITRKARVKPSLVPKALGRRAAPKDSAPIRDRAHLARVANHPCLVCGQTFVQAHHIRECLPRTMGVRVGDDMTVPLCVMHHAELHTENTDAFWKRYRIDAVGWARAFYRETVSPRVSRTTGNSTP